MEWMFGLLLTWVALLGFCYPAIAATATPTVNSTGSTSSSGVVDEYSSDSRYIGIVGVQWKEELYTNCPVQVFGPITNAIFYLGPSRSLTGDDSSWLFAKLSASDANGFWATFQTSPLDGNKPLPNSWYINAELNYTGYEISGRVPLESGTGPGAEAGNALRGKLAVKEDAGICGLEEDAVFELTYQPVSTVLGGYVDGESAMVTINGTYTSSDNTRRIAYSFVFDGKRDVSSAKMSTKGVQPSWTKEESATTSGNYTRPTSSLFVHNDGISTNLTAIPSSTTSSGTYNLPDRKHTNPGKVAGTVIGALAALSAVVIIGIWLFRRRMARKEEEEAFPELGYLASTGLGGHGLARGDGSQAYSLPVRAVRTPWMMNERFSMASGTPSEWEMRSAESARKF